VALTTSIADPGTDDVTVAIDWGDGATESRTYYSDGLGPDPFPSPGGMAVNLSDVAAHAYGTIGAFVVTITVADDDGGVTVVSLVVFVG